MYFYSFTLQEPQKVVNAASGNFTGKSSEGVDEVVVNLGTQISLYRQIGDEDESTFSRIFTRPTFCHVLNVQTLSFPGEEDSKNFHDFLGLIADSGNITIADLSGDGYKEIICIPYGRTGMRRMEPGFYFNISLCGRAIFAAALEKYKIAWPIAQNDQAIPEISAPIETTRSHAFVYHTVALDVGYESPTFAVIERLFKPDKSKPEPRFVPEKHEKLLVYYEVDPSIKSIVRRAENKILPTATHLVPIPGKLYDCPGGVLVCSVGNAQYFPTIGAEGSLIMIPMRSGGEPSIIIASATFASNGEWFAFLENQFGDLLVANMNEHGEIVIKYCDTIPLSKSILILRQGVLAAFGEVCENNFYYIRDPDGDDALEFEPNTENTRITQFTSTGTMSNLIKMAVVPSEYESYSGDIVTLHGTKTKSSLKFTRRGIPIEILHQVGFGGQSYFIKAVKKDPKDQYDSYILISSFASTRILEVTKDGKISEFNDSIFVRDNQTLDVFQMYNPHSYSTVQIHSKGIRVCTQDLVQKNWSRDQTNAYIVASASNTGQVVIAYNDSTLILFEAGDNAIPNEVSSFHLEIDGTIVALAIPQPPEGIRTAKWLAIGTDQMMVLIVSLGGHTEEDVKNKWTITARQIVNDKISSLAFLSVPGVGHVLHIGNDNGVLQRAILDDNEGKIDNPQVRYLGRDPITFNKIVINNRNCLIANSSSPFLIQGLSISQVAAPNFSTICQIKASFCPDIGFAGITGNNLMIFEINDLHASMSTISVPIPMTPRQIVYIPNTSSVFVICSDVINGVWHNIYMFYDYVKNELSTPIEYGEGFCATSAAFIESENAICVGFAENLRFNPRSCTSGRIVLIDPISNAVHHTTNIEDIPGAIGQFENGILCGIGRNIRIYKVGMKSLLKYCESRTIPFFISFVNSIGNIIVVGDSAESYHFVKFDKANSIMTPFCDDCTPRFPLSTVLLDRATVASGDRFGNFVVLRIPAEVSDDAEVDPSGVGMVWEHRDFSGTPNKFDMAASFHIGDPITGMSLALSGHCIIYATISGQLGAMIPFSTDADASIMKRLEIEMRKKQLSMCGRIHEQFRSYYTPLTNVIDGDLVRSFLDLKYNEQEEIAKAMKCTTFDISRQLVSIESIV